MKTVKAFALTALLVTVPTGIHESSAHLGKPVTGDTLALASSSAMRAYIALIPGRDSTETTQHAKENVLILPSQRQLVAAEADSGHHQGRTTLAVKDEDFSRPARLAPRIVTVTRSGT
jgi:hypothetical protein